MQTNPTKVLTGIPTIDEIKEAFAPILRRGGAIKAILFGSYANGIADRYSDIDLIIVVDTDLKWTRRYELFEGLIQAWPRAMDVLIYTPQEFDTMLAEGRAFLEDAVQQGVVIYEE
ncbi:MAG: nucleotidyltransferase domain-containing protein [SAR202 cluster bacterium]|nr:nucleotidyltransferase domain-containing protein [SAR202 cluster bacterium]